jgi:mutual gliding-motility protein MglA
MLINQSSKEITSKIVYYGPALSGKTTNLQYLYEVLDPGQRGKLLTISTEGDRTIFFDFMPIELGEVKGFKLRVQLYTVPGQVFYEETRKRVLKGSDGIVFVADSQKDMLTSNREAFEQLKVHLSENGLNPDKTPIVLQFNKRDLKNILTFEELDKALNPGNIPFFEAIATEGLGVEDTLKSISKLVVNNILNQLTETQKIGKGGSLSSKTKNDFFAMDTKKLLSELGASTKKKQSAESLFDDSKTSPGLKVSGDKANKTGEEAPAPFPNDPAETDLFEQETGGEPLLLTEEDELKVGQNETEEIDTGDYSVDKGSVAIRAGEKISLSVDIEGKKFILTLELKPE